MFFFRCREHVPRPLLGPFRWPLPSANTNRGRRAVFFSRILPPSPALPSTPQIRIEVHADVAHELVVSAFEGVSFCVCVFGGGRVFFFFFSLEIGCPRNGPPAPTRRPRPPVRLALCHLWGPGKAAGGVVASTQACGAPRLRAAVGWLFFPGPVPPCRLSERDRRPETSGSRRRPACRPHFTNLLHSFFFPSTHTTSPAPASKSTTTTASPASPRSSTPRA